MYIEVLNGINRRSSASFHSLTSIDRIGLIPTTKIRLQRIRVSDYLNFWYLVWIFLLLEHGGIPFYNPKVFTSTAIALMAWTDQNRDRLHASTSRKNARKNIKGNKIFFDQSTTVTRLSNKTISEPIRASQSVHKSADLNQRSERNGSNYFKEMSKDY